MKLKRDQAVRLRSGGPVMRVLADQIGDECVTCSWHAEGVVYSASFHPDTLDVVKSTATVYVSLVDERPVPCPDNAHVGPFINPGVMGAAICENCRSAVRASDPKLALTRKISARVAQLAASNGVTRTFL